MHQKNILILGSTSFISTLNELKPFLKFNPHTASTTNDYDVIIFHIDILKNQQTKALIDKSNALKICAKNKNAKNSNHESYVQLPTTLNELNSIVESVLAKKTFNKNSSIKLKNYLLDKNEKKLKKNNKFVILTEKEVQLLELLMSQKKPITKKNILSFVWQYSSEADTHTVETHIYRLRKKISNKFLDEKFILINKDGYYL